MPDIVQGVHCRIKDYLSRLVPDPNFLGHVDLRSNDALGRDEVERHGNEEVAAEGVEVGLAN